MAVEDVSDDIFEEAVAAARRVGADFDVGLATAILGHRRAYRGDLETGKRLLAEALGRLVLSGGKRFPAYAMDCLAEVAAAEDDLSRAVQILAATDAILAGIGVPADLPFADRRRRLLVELKEQLGEEGFAKEWEIGHALGFQQAVELALEVAA